MPPSDPKPTHCAYCGAHWELTVRQGWLFCQRCRTKFIIAMARRLRKAPTRKSK